MPNIALIPGSTPQLPLTAVVDGFPAEQHKVSVELGGEPVEDGVEATDHAVFSKEEVILTGWVSSWRGGRTPARAWSTVRRLARTVTPITLITEWGTYPEMLIAEADAPKDARGMRFTVKLVWINRVGVMDSELPAGQVSGPASGRSGNVQRGRVAL